MQRWNNHRHYQRKFCLKCRGVLTALAILTLLGACQSPTLKFDQTAASLGLQRDVVMGAGFQHVLFWRNGGPNKTLHVYLGGDGTPVNAGRPAKDPTPRNPLMLRLMLLDPDPAVYVGRPCYHGLAATAGCSGDLWTTARYSESVVSSLAAAIRRIMMSRGYERISLFGHSGGGTLAMLLAVLGVTKSFSRPQSSLSPTAAHQHSGAPLRRQPRSDCPPNNSCAQCA